MKLIAAIRVIEEREKIQREAEKEMERRGLLFRHKSGIDAGQIPNQILVQEPTDQKNLVHVQSVFPREDIIALKEKTGEKHIKEAIARAVYFYLNDKAAPDATKIVLDNYKLEEVSKE